MQTDGCRRALSAAAVASSIAVTGCQQPRFAWQPACLISCQATVEGDRVNQPEQFPAAPPTPQPKPKRR